MDVFYAEDLERFDDDTRALIRQALAKDDPDETRVGRDNLIAKFGEKIGDPSNHWDRFFRDDGKPYITTMAKNVFCAGRVEVVKDIEILIPSGHPDMTVPLLPRSHPMRCYYGASIHIDGKSTGVFRRHDFPLDQSPKIRVGDVAAAVDDVSLVWPPYEYYGKDHASLSEMAVDGFIPLVSGTYYPGRLTTEQKQILDVPMTRYIIQGYDMGDTDELNPHVDADGASHIFYLYGLTTGGFLIRDDVGYPDDSSEMRFIERATLDEVIALLEPTVDAAGIEYLMKSVARMKDIWSGVVGSSTGKGSPW